MCGRFTYRPPSAYSSLRRKRSTLNNMKLLLLFAAVSLVVVSQDYDVVIHGGRLIDGTGNPSFLADVAIQDGKIARIGNLADAHAKRVIDAKGLIVSPGFIDIHNHSDYTIIT